ncbi:sugar ABC transporter substrate-binding protein [Treponema pedis]|uniref:Extracellular solute-binding protein n=1 Tax=Treponema pedis TaxID=409322 RepID=A0A7S6WN95_9SPIR|nr:extracellular solute-binding protein [Treponema pedis]QOW60207.1 extracellular solute-binding protein [Treponema pedis]
MKCKRTVYAVNLFLFGIILFSGLITSCGGKNEKEKNVLTVQAEQGWISYYEAAAKRVQEANPNTEIKLIEVGAFDHLDKIDATDASNQDVADLFAIPADRLYGLAENEVLASIDSKKLAAELGGWTDFDSGLGGNLKINNEYLAFPLNIETLITFVNVTNAQKDGIDYSKPFEISNTKDADKILLPLFDAWYGVAATNSANIELLSKKSDNVLFSDITSEFNNLSNDKKEAIKIIYEYWKLNYKNKTPLFDPEAGWGYIDTEFSNGNKGVIRLGGPWDTASISEQTNGNFAIFPIDHITLNGKPLLHWKGGWGLAINSRIEKDADKYALALQMIKEIVNPKYAAEFFKATGKILENVPADVYEKLDLEKTEKEVIKAVIASYTLSPARPLFKEWGKVWDTWRNAILSWNSVNPQTVEEAYKELKASFDAMMTNFNM